MTNRPLVALLPVVLGASTLIATLAQCREGASGAALATAARPAAAQDPKPPAAPPPDLIRLLVSGAMHGRLEPCGCASGQLGGLARRAQHIGEQRNYDVLLEGGDLVETATELDLLKLYTANTVLFGMQNRYDALGVGARDLALPRAEWAAFLGETPVVATNLKSSEPGWPGRPFVAKTVRGIDLRIASFLLELPEPLRAADSPITLVPTAEAWQQALAGATPDTRRVVMVHGTDTTIRAFIPQLDPPPDLVVGVDPGYVEPSPSAASVGGVPLVFTGIRGRVLLAVSLFREAAGPRAICELVPLPGSKTLPGGGGDPDVREEILRHRHDVKEQDVLGEVVRQKPTGSGAAYFGSHACKTCHAAAFDVWAKSKHAHAWETLEAAEKDPTRYGWPVTAYPDCVSCHVVGFGEQTGFVSAAETPDLTDVGCERCHGPGSDHVTSGGKQKLGLIGGVAASQLCVQCHDFEQSPTFLYGDKWPLIQHGK